MTSSYDEATLTQIRRGRKNFLSMATAYSLGVLNDNFFRQSVMLLAVAANLVWLQGYATIIFSAPFILFAAPAGWMADRFSKRNVVIGAKVLELAAMLCGAAGILLTNWTLILVMLGIMGLQSTIFNTSLNGSIPELYPTVYVTRANAYIRIAVTASMLLGLALAGVAIGHFGGIAVCFVVIGVSLVGLVISFGAPSRPAAAPHKPFPWTGPLNTLKTLYEIRKDRLLVLSIAASTFFWFLATLQSLVINPMGLNQFKFSATLTSILMVAELVGVAVGGMLASRIATGKKWFHVLAPAMLVMSACMLAVSFIPFAPAQYRLALLLSALLVMGIAGGTLSIPINSFIQIRPAPDRKGAVISSFSFATFCGILLAGPAANLLNHIFDKTYTNSFAVIGIAGFLVSAGLYYALREKGKICSENL